MGRDFPDGVPAPRRAELMERLRAELEAKLGWLASHRLYAMRTEWPFVVFESPHVNLELGYGLLHGPALSLAASIRRRDDAESYSLGTAQRLLGVPEHPPLNAEADLPAAVEGLSDALHTLEPLLAGDEDAFQRLHRRDRELTAEIALEDELRVARPEARDAFKTRDYARVIALLDPLEGHLERHEQGWLDYARRKRG